MATTEFDIQLIELPIFTDKVAANIVSRIKNANLPNDFDSENIKKWNNIKSEFNKNRASWIELMKHFKNSMFKPKCIDNKYYGFKDQIAKQIVNLAMSAIVIGLDTVGRPNCVYCWDPEMSVREMIKSYLKELTNFLNSMADSAIVDDKYITDKFKTVSSIIKFDYVLHGNWCWEFMDEFKFLPIV